MSPVLTDPGRVEAKRRCEQSLGSHAQCVARLKVKRELAGDYNPAKEVILIASVNDSNGQPIANQVVPGSNWSYVRDQCQEPFARGVMGREGVAEWLETFDPESATELRAATGLPVVIINFGVAAVFRA